MPPVAPSVAEADWPAARTGRQATLPPCRRTATSVRNVAGAFVIASVPSAMSSAPMSVNGEQSVISATPLFVIVLEPVPLSFAAITGLGACHVFPERYFVPRRNASPVSVMSFP